MAKVILEFNLPEEQEDYNYAMRGRDYSFALSDLYNFLRQDSKYGEGKFADVYTKFWEILKEHGIEI